MLSRAQNIFHHMLNIKYSRACAGPFLVVNNKTKMNMACVSSHRCLGSVVVWKKEFRLKGFISLEEINLSRQKQKYEFYLFDKLWYFPAKHVIYFSKKVLQHHIFVRIL